MRMGEGAAAGGEGDKGVRREGLLRGGDRLSCAVCMERVNGNAFAQIPVALWYSHQATGDALQKQRFETFWERWTSEGWGLGSERGVSATLTREERQGEGDWRGGDLR